MEFYEANLSFKIFLNGIQQYIENIVHRVQFFYPRMQGQFKSKIIIIIHLNSRVKRKFHMISSIEAEQNFSKIQHHFIIKLSIWLGIESNFFGVIKGIC